MMNRISALILILSFGITLPFPAGANNLQQLEQRCEQTREKLIAPLRQEAIDQCIADREGSRSSRDAREHCERFYQDFGNGGTTQSGGFRQRMFHEIPECLEYYEAQQNSRRR
jgi:hypothetical protein